MSTAGTRPTQRSSQLVGGERTNDSSAASAIGTNTACAQYSTTTTSTAPPNSTQCLKPFDSFIIRACPWGCSPTSAASVPLTGLGAAYLIRASDADPAPARSRRDGVVER